MTRLVRLNEVQYTDDEIRIELLQEEGFVIEELEDSQESDLPPVDPYKGMKKDELLALAAERGLDVTEANTVPEIKAALADHE